MPLAARHLALINVPAAPIRAETVLPPTNVAGTAGNGFVTLTWVNSTTTGTTGLAIYQDGDQTGSITPGSTSYTVTGLTDGTAYSFQLQTLKGDAESVLTAAISLTPRAPVASGGSGIVPPPVSDLTVRVFNPGTYNADTVVGRSGELRRYYNRMLNFINDPSDTTKLINAWDSRAAHRGQYNIMRHVLGIDMTCLTFSARATKSIKPLQLCRQLWDKMWAIKDKDSSPDGTAEGSDKNGDYWGWTYGTEATAHETNGGTGKKVMLEDGVGCMGMVTAHALHVNRDLDSTFGKAADEMVNW